jgi:hypothetical protein
MHNTNIPKVFGKQTYTYMYLLASYEHKNICRYTMIIIYTAVYKTFSKNYLLGFGIISLLLQLMLQ